MESIFVAENKSLVYRVYPEYVRETLKKDVGLIADTVYTKEEALKKPVLTEKARFLFSTWSMPSFTEEEIKICFPSLEAVFYAAGTVQKFVRPFLNVGIRVFSAWAANAVPVAEFTTSQILLANKGYFGACRLASKGAYQQAKAFSEQFGGNLNIPVGMIGAGMIGSMVINRLKEHRLPVMVYDPFLPEEKARQMGVQKSSLKEIFKTCQTISNHLANNEQTKGILHYELFRCMLPNATFINTGRGAQVVEVDLARALQEAPGRSALLDVTYPEPPEDNSVFYNLPNVYLTPHIAGSQGQELYRMAEYMQQEAQALLSGEHTQYEVTAAMLSTMA